MCPLQDRSESSSSDDIGNDDFHFEEAVGWDAHVEFDQYCKNKGITDQLWRRANAITPLRSIIFKHVTFECRESHNGWTHSGRCPFPGHRDTNPSFGYNSIDDRFSCFGCHRSGGSVQFLAALENKTWFEIAKRLIANGDISKAILEIEESQVAPADELMFEFSIHMREFRDTHADNPRAWKYAEDVQRACTLYIARNYKSGTMNAESIAPIINQCKLHLENFGIEEE